MKKSTTMKHLALALMVCVAQSVNAQELDPDLLNYVATGDTIGTEYVPDENYVPVTWEKKGASCRYADVTVHPLHLSFAQGIRSA